MNIQPDKASQQLTSGIQNFFGAMFGRQPQAASMPGRSVPPPRARQQAVPLKTRNLTEILASAKTAAASQKRVQTLSAKQGMAR